MDVDTIREVLEEMGYEVLTYKGRVAISGGIDLDEAFEVAASVCDNPLAVVDALRVGKHEGDILYWPKLVDRDWD